MQRNFNNVKNLKYLVLLSYHYKQECIPQQWPPLDVSTMGTGDVGLCPGVLLSVEGEGGSRSLSQRAQVSVWRLRERFRSLSIRV